MNNDAERQLLWNFFGAYFHQDWDLDAEDEDEVVAQYAKTATREEREMLSNAIAKYSQSQISDKELEDDLCGDLGCESRPSNVGIPVRDWLQHIAAQLLKE